MTLSRTEFLTLMSRNPQDHLYFNPCIPVGLMRSFLSRRFSAFKITTEAGVLKQSK